MGCCPSTPAGSQQQGTEQIKVLTEEDFKLLQDKPGSGLTTIPETGERGITVAQITRLHTTAKKWVEDGDWIDDFSKTAYTIKTLNLYGANRDIILPATKKSELSFVEYISALPKAPSWFASHFWGEPIGDFLKCVSEHEKLRIETDSDGNPGTIAYWVCAYANRQHRLGEEISANPRETGFFHALSRCVGVLLVLDARATPFKRIWCQYEAAVALQDKDLPRLRFDISIVDEQGAGQVLTEGLAEGDKTENDPVGSKTVREDKFPVSVLRDALDVIDVVQAQASVEEDYTRILNSINAVKPKDLLKVPDVNHSNIEGVNNSLRSLVAERVFSATTGDGLQAQHDLVKVMIKDKGKRSLMLPCYQREGLKGFSVFEPLFKNLHVLQQIDLNVGDSGVQDLQGLEAVSNCTQLEHFSLDTFNTAVTDLKPLEALSKCTQLKHFSLCIMQCKIVDLQPLQAVCKLTQLKHFSLNMVNVEAVAESTIIDLQPLQAISNLVSLEHLSLDLSGSDITDLKPLQGLVGLKRLKFFCLDTRDCDLLAEEHQKKFDSIDDFRAAMANAGA